MSSQGNGDFRFVAAIIRRHGRVLLCHRSPQRDWYPERWDLPGELAHEDEIPSRALVRELWEELGIRIEPPQAEPFAHVQGADFRRDIWLIDQWVGEPSMMDPDMHDALAWVNAEETLGLQLADGRLPALIQAALAE